ncbi:hypothetical protein GCM10011391_19900 [Pullulanibacillus camelliae]|uniref:Uncharacterized protein n=1 Tax=Pullulanibacillus camelliae TaxID=1707096 RepID=A0A8J2VP07_9BACL|nr:hypothetical protein [Pullulanibacillus camelliae]GGE41149.1 hypothetical protein GCM10011391_19900 [Pullulanibacillus camelliae]
MKEITFLCIESLASVHNKNNNITTHDVVSNRGDLRFPISFSAGFSSPIVLAYKVCMGHPQALIPAGLFLYYQKITSLTHIKEENIRRTLPFAT